MAIQTINPATGELLKNFTPHSADEVDSMLAKADREFHDWKTKSYRARAVLFKKVAHLLREQKEKLGDVITLEMGKPLSQSMAEVEKCALVCDYYAKEAEGFLKEIHVPTESSHSYVRHDPLGIILAVMPWNFPFWQVFRAAAPALMAGNVMVLKHSSNVPQCALLLEKLFKEAGFPAGVFTTVLIEGRETDKVLIDDRVKAVSVTGSEAAGRKVAETAGAHLKKCVLELGGSDPFIILEDADLEMTTSMAVSARTQNAGQSCIAAKRFIVVDKIAEQFKELFVTKMRALKMGDPTDTNTQIGPMAREDLLIELHKQVQESIKKGAKVLTGGERMHGQGYYYKPTVLDDVKSGMPAYDQELFGPVAAIIEVKNEKEAIYVANDTRFGLGASLWTKDIEKARKIASLIEAGAVFVNKIVASDPRLPFGGIKKSGFGRELGEHGIKEFVNVKTVMIQ